MDALLAPKRCPAYSKATWKYANDMGLRSDPIKDSIAAETGEISHWITNRQECELFESMLKFANAKNCIEVGVLTGSSALSIARGLGEGGKLYALDISEYHTNIAKRYWEQEGVSDKIELILAPAEETLRRFIEEGKEGTFDFGFIDADKEGYCAYYELILRLLRPGGIIAVDNVIWHGSVADPARNDPDTAAIRELNRIMINDPRINNVILPLSDGINLAIKL